VNAGRTAILLLLTLAPLALAGCSKKPDPPRWLVKSHIGSEWTFTRRAVDETPARRIVAVCTSYHWQGHDAVKGDDACTLPVGGGMVEPLQMLAHPVKSDAVKLPMFDLLDSNTVAITEGDGTDKTIQLFQIKRDEALP
jgi:hypothetical protein